MIDFVSNVLGGLLGAFVSAAWRNRSPQFKIYRWTALLAAALALALALPVWASAIPTNTRGVTSPGTMEAYWRFDEDRGRAALDSSGHGLHGRFSKDPKRTAGRLGRCIAFDGFKDYVDFSRSQELRLVGSMTITAWIKATAFPVGDAAIVSQLHGGFAYQLDATIDQGPRSIGFKLTTGCGKPMARYGATPLATGEWYHVAGVFDAEARTLDVYLDGKTDNGLLVGPVADKQQSSRSSVYVGRRSDLEGYEFSGSIDEVHIYSLALKRDEIAEDMRGNVLDRLSAARDTRERRNIGRGRELKTDSGSSCGVATEGGDERTPAIAAVIGVLAANRLLRTYP